MNLARNTAGGNATNTGGNTTRTPRPPGNAAPDLKCSKCGKPAKLLTVTKTGLTKGRKFYKCPECNFFKWADEVTSTEAGPSSSTASTSGGSGPSTLGNF